MTPDELAIIRGDGQVMHDLADAFATTFYATLFELAPATRSLFPDDLVAQRGKLVDELGFLIEAATSIDDGLGDFVERASELGRRHVEYGVTGNDYVPVGQALIAALRSCIDDWDDEHEAAWMKLYRLIADVMREGTEARLFSAG
ncbi:MAG: globin domain-containing protein [Ilumatobacter sp.]|uniref:globin domain-containing protein n=1 Tax=Ilumatobacter sp. TaxID=1967498 RepID=UPI00262D48EE|nr:globin domain-containing protein [Ilumatobacter sp.]MDJ0768506.1 globin domain-containing protein [Ilumatobacter sp.]